MARAIVELWCDGYDNEDDMRAALAEEISEACRSSAIEAKFIRWADEECQVCWQDAQERQQ